VPSEPFATYLEAAESFADLVAELPADLSGPGLGDWDLRALVGHTSRALVTVLEYLHKPAASIELRHPADYFLAIGSVGPDAGVAQRGVAAGAALGADPVASVRRLVELVTDELAGADPDQPLATFAGGSRLADYLPTRTFELVVHGLDISLAVPVPWQPPEAAVRSALELATEVALRRGEGTLLLRLVTGREPGGFSIV
jgi:uncharacterized protein (TIGR03083 family)